MSHWSLTDYYTFMDRMISDHNYSKSDLDSLVPFERDILISIINQRSQKQSNEAPSAPTEF